jgi:hypothetical protein
MLPSLGPGLKDMVGCLSSSPLLAMGLMLPSFGLEFPGLKGTISTSAIYASFLLFPSTLDTRGGNRKEGKGRTPQGQEKPGIIEATHTRGGELEEALQWKLNKRRKVEQKRKVL